MAGKKHSLNKEKIFSMIISFGIIVALGYGIYSVAMNMNDTKNDNNIVNLDDTEDGNIAMKTEDVPDVLPGDVQGEITTQDDDTASVNAGATAENYNKTEVVDNGVIYEKPEYTFSEEDILTWPVSGEVLLKYSMDTSIFFKTLGVYKCNPAMSIASAVGTDVCAAADGIVTDISENEETGTTVTIDIGSGYMATYGLMEGLTVAVDDKVESGQVIGKVAEPTAYYEKEGSNLYFKLTKDDEPVDPTYYLD